MTEKDEFTVPVEVAEPDPSEPAGVPPDDVKARDDAEINALQNLLSEERQKAAAFEEKFKHTLADFQNLERKTKSDIEAGVNDKVGRFVLDFLQIYDDFTRAKEVAAENKIVADGFDSISKNMDSLLAKYAVSPIDSLGEIFDPNFHEAISVVEDDSLDDNTITREIRKGYISHQRVIRPALVEISKKSRSE